MKTDPTWRAPRLCADCAEPFNECVCRTPDWHECPVCHRPDGQWRFRTDADAGLAAHIRREHPEYLRTASPFGETAGPEDVRPARGAGVREETNGE